MEVTGEHLGSKLGPNAKHCLLAAGHVGPKRNLILVFEKTLWLILNITLLSQAKKKSALNHTLALFFNECIVLGSVRMQLEVFKVDCGAQ